MKLLDAGQRLPVHAHPDVPFARKHLGLAHGKTEAWVFLEPAVVHLGFVRDVGDEELATWLAEQDAAAMLAAMHALEVAPGDAVLVPAGLVHAIGEGAFLVELQEPTDLSILLEWANFAIDGAQLGHLGLGFATALRRCRPPRLVLRSGSGAARRSSRDRRRPPPGRRGVLSSRPFQGRGRVGAGLRRGRRRIRRGRARLRCRAGAAAVRANVGRPIRGRPVTVEGGADLEVLRCRPPSPTARK